MFTVLWDNDGVLVDTEGLFFQATQQVLRSIGIAFSPEQFIEYSLKRGESAFQLAAEQGASAEEIKALRAERDRLYADALRTTNCVMEGIEQVLQHLHRRVQMGVVTSSRREHCEIAHANTGLLPFFQFVIAREDYEHSKPHPEPYLTALDRYELRLEQCLVVEDSERGLAAATAAGLRCLIVPTPWTSGGNFRTAHQVLSTLDAVPQTVFQLLESERK